MARRSLSGARVLLTGATSGIGQALALELAGQGARIVLAGRRQDRLDDVARAARRLGPQGQVATETGDVTDPQWRERAIQRCRNEWDGLDILINNAGIGGQGPFAQAQPQRLRRILEVNVVAPLELTRLALPLLSAGRQPLVACVGSVLSHFAVADKSEYCASKFALRGFCDALRQELRPSKISVLLICPSTTRTEFFEKAIPSSAPPASEVAAGQDPTAQDPADDPYRMGAMTAEDVARQAARAMQRDQREIFLTASARWLRRLHQLSPSAADWLLSRLAR